MLTSYRGPDISNAFEAAALAEKLDLPYSESQARFITATGSIQAGDLESANREADKGLEVSRKLKNRFRLVGALSASMENMLVQGDFEQVRALGTEAYGLEPSDDRVLRDMAVAEYLSGNKKKGDAWFNEIIEAYESIPESRRSSYLTAQATVGAVLAFVYGDETTIARIEGWFSEKLSKQLHERMPGAALMYTVLKPDLPKAKEILNLVDKSEVLSGWKWQRGSFGTVAAFVGDYERASKEFEDAYTLFRKARMMLPLMWTCLHYSEALIRFDWPAEISGGAERVREKTVALQDEGIALARDMGSQPLLERFLSKREVLKA